MFSVVLRGESHSLDGDVIVAHRHGLTNDRCQRQYLPVTDGQYRRIIIDIIHHHDGRVGVLTALGSCSHRPVIVQRIRLLVLVVLALRYKIHTIGQHDGELQRLHTIVPVVQKHMNLRLVSGVDTCRLGIDDIAVVHCFRGTDRRAYYRHQSPEYYATNPFHKYSYLLYISLTISVMSATLILPLALASAALKLKPVGVWP